MKIYGYVRVSTDGQAESGLGLEAQLKAIEVYAKKHGYEISQIFRDEGIGGATLEERPGLMEVLNILKKGDVLLVAKRDRLARGDHMALVQMAVNKKKARIISSAGEGTESGDQDDPMSYMMRGMTDLFAGFERLLIKSRTKAALQAKKARGERVGHIPFGHKLADDGIHLEFEEDEQDILRQLRDLKAEGLSLREIATELNKRGAFNRGGSAWNHASIHRITARKAA